MTTPPPFEHRLRVRYAEVDAQGVVFNAHWLTYVDDASTRFLESIGVPVGEVWDAQGGADWDLMVRATSLDFTGSAGFDDEVVITVVPTRLGRTSVDLTFLCHVDGTPVVTVVTTYVCTDRRARRPQPLPDELRSMLLSAPGATAG